MNQNLKVLCHDNRHMMNGTLVNASSTGADLLCDRSMVTPAFPRKANVLLNLFDERSGMSVDLKARVSGLTREGGRWVYRVRWDEMPEIARA